MRRPSRLSPLAFSLILAACGGGGSGDSAPAASSPANTGNPQAAQPFIPSPLPVTQNTPAPVPTAPAPQQEPPATPAPATTPTPSPEPAPAAAATPTPAPAPSPAPVPSPAPAIPAVPAVPTGPATPATPAAPASAARLNQPFSLAFDAARQILYVGELSGAVRSITSDGTVTTIMRTMTGARAMAVGPDGTLYVADRAAVLRRSADGMSLTTFAGEPNTVGSNNGPGSAARFRLIRGLAVTVDNTVIVADADNGLVRRVTQDGMVSTIAGNGTRGTQRDGDLNSAILYYPTGVAVAGNTVAFLDQDRVGGTLLRQVDPTGQISTLTAAGYLGVGLAFDGRRHLFSNADGLRAFAPGSESTTISALIDGLTPCFGGDLCAASQRQHTVVRYRMEGGSIGTPTVIVGQLGQAGSNDR